MFTNVKLGTKILFALLVMACLTMIIGLVAFLGQSRSLSSLKEISQNSDVSIREVAELRRLLMWVKSQERTLLIKGITKERLDSSLKQINEASDGAKKSWENYFALSMEPEEGALAKDVRAEWNDWLGTINTWVSHAEKYHKNPTDQAYLQLYQENETKVRPVEHSLDTKIDKLAEMNVKEGDRIEEESIAAAGVAQTTNGIMVLVCLIIALAAGIGFSRNITQLVNALNGEVKKISDAVENGELDVRGDGEVVTTEFRGIIDGFNTAIDSFVAPMKMSNTYLDQISRGELPPLITEQYRGDFNLTKNSLNQVIDSIGALVKDAHLLAQAGADGQLNTRANVDKHKGEYRRIVEGMNLTLENVAKPLAMASKYIEQISRGNVPPKIEENYRGDYNQLKLSLNKCIDALNNVVSDLNLLVKNAEAGQLSQRVEANRHEGHFRLLVEGMNKLFETVVAPLNEASTYMQKISRGEIPPPITATYAGDFAVLINSLNICIEAIKKLVNDTKVLAKAAGAGQLTVRAEANQHAGDFRVIIEGMNETMDQVIGPLKVTEKYLTQLAQGIIPEKITAHYQGDLAALKNNLNLLVDILNGLLSETNKLISHAGEGNLMVRGDNSKFTGNWAQLITGMNEIIQIMHDAVARVSATVGQVTSASNQIAISSQAVAQGASEQASAIEESSSSMEEMAGMTKQNADNTQQARILAEQANRAAESGTSCMSQMTEAMSKIRAAAEGTAQIIRDINEISFQTNLLALNAAVEAARAGDAGRGFAVVADEVRNLALRSKDAAKRTEELIHQSVQLSNEGATATQQVNEILSQIADSVGKSTAIVNEIAVASQEQARGIDQVNRAISQMDQVVQQSASNSEQSASAAQELAAQAQELFDIVGQFQVNQRVISGKISAPKALPSAITRKAKSAVTTTTPAKAKANEIAGGHEELAAFESDPDFKQF